MKQEYYFQQMNREEKQVYRAMYDGFTALSPEFPVLRLERKELSEIFFRLRLDHPAIFYVSSFTYRFFDQADYVHLIPEYLFEKKKIKEHQKALEGRITRLLRPMQELTPEEQEKSIHDFILENVTYDKLQKQYSHEIIGPLQQGIGVCEGIAKSVKILCDALNVWCIIAICGNNPEKGIKYRHTWNIIRLDGKYYHLDATFDNSLGRSGSGKPEIRYDYFNLDDKAVFRDHEPLIAPAPACTDNSRFYYKDKKLSFTKTEDVYKRSLQAAKKGKTLTFHWRGGYLTREVLGELLDLMQQAGAQKNKTAVVSLNWAQAVLRLHYVDTAEGGTGMTSVDEKSANNPEAAERQVHFTMEEANEGEQIDIE